MAAPRSRDRQRLYGTHCVLEALRARRRRLDRVLVRPGWRRPEREAIEAAAREAGVRLDEAAEGEFGEGARPGAPAQGVALDAGPLPELGLEAALALPEGARRLVALDGVEDPQNVGAIARVAEASGAAGLVLTRRRAPPLSPALARASAGAVEWLPVIRVGNLGQALKLLKSNGFWVVAADPGGSLSVFDAPDRVLTGDLVLVLGAEGRGLRPGVQAAVDHALRIPLAGRVESLNVATAGAVLAFEMWRRAHGPENRTKSP